MNQGSALRIGMINYPFGVGLFPDPKATKGCGIGGVKRGLLALRILCCHSNDLR